jgi:putative ABC transport system permease protein
MSLYEIFRQTVATFRAHKMRIFLTMFGIVWGIASVILLVGLGKGFSSDQKRRMQTLGKDLVIVWGGRTSSQIGGLAAGREISLTIDDARLIHNECYLIKHVSPELRRTIPQVSQFNSANRGVVGMWPSYQDFRSLLVSEGRLITDDDEKDSNRVVILGSAARRQLYPGQPAVGATLLIKSVPYTVIGVLVEKKQNSNYSGPDNDYLFAPYSSIARDFPPPEKKGIVRGYLEDIVFEVGDSETH